MWPPRPRTQAWEGWKNQNWVAAVTSMGLKLLFFLPDFWGLLSMQGFKYNALASSHYFITNQLEPVVVVYDHNESVLQEGRTACEA